MRVMKAFIKPFEAPQGTLKIKIQVTFYFNTSFLTHEGPMPPII